MSIMKAAKVAPATAMKTMNAAEATAVTVRALSRSSALRIGLTYRKTPP